MKTLKITFLLIILSYSAMAQNWKSDRQHSRLGFRTTHMTISEINGIFKSFEIQINAKNKDFSDAVIELVADIGSIDTEVEQRDNHLKSADFFDVENYPELCFTSTSITEVSKNKYSVTGNLTIRDNTKTVTVLLTYNGSIENEYTQKITAGFKLIGTIKRTDFFIGSSIPYTIISDEVNIVADMELLMQ